MFSFFKKLLTSTNSEGKEIDFENSISVIEIHNKTVFLNTIIQEVPKNSIWSIEGIDDQEILELLKSLEVVDATNVHKATIWPKQQFIKVELTDEAKNLITKNLPKWDLDWNLIHQHIYKDDFFYLTSYDNLSSACTWISKELVTDSIIALEKNGQIEFEKETD